MGLDEIEALGPKEGKEFEERGEVRECHLAAHRHHIDLEVRRGVLESVTGHDRPIDAFEEAELASEQEPCGHRRGDDPAPPRSPSG